MSSHLSSGHAPGTNAGSRSAASVKATSAAATLISGSNNPGPGSGSATQDAPLDPAIKYFHPPPGRFGVSGGSGASLGYLGAEVVDSGSLGHGSSSGGGGGGGARKSGSAASSHHKKKPHPALASLFDYHPAPHGRTHSRETSYVNHYGGEDPHGNVNDNDFIYNQFHAGGSHLNSSHGQSGSQQAIPKVRETMNKTEETCAGESRGVRYFVDFNTLPLSFIIDYLNRNLIPATFGQAPKSNNVLNNSNNNNPNAPGSTNGINNPNLSLSSGVVPGQVQGQGEEGVGGNGNLDKPNGVVGTGGVEGGGQVIVEGDGWHEDRKACDPKQIFALPPSASQSGLDADGVPFPPTLPHDPSRSNTNNSNGTRAGNGNAQTSRRGGKKSVNRKQSSQADAEGQGGQGQPGQRRRHTNTSMTAAVIEESIMMAQQEEERRAQAEEEERKVSGTGDVPLDETEVEEPVKVEVEQEAPAPVDLDGGDKVDEVEPVDTVAKLETEDQPGQEESAMDVDVEEDAVDEDGPKEEKRVTRGRGARKRKADERDDSVDLEGGDGEDQDRAARSGSRKSETSPKPSGNALRRSGRKPLPKGAPLATVHKQTRINYSPTPSITSSDSDYVAPGYQAILSDLDQASQVLRNRARDHWCETLKAGMMNPDEQRLKLANGGQVPTWNPTMLSMVDTGPAGGGGIGYGPGPGQVTGLIGMHGTKTGGLMKETDIVVDFLYTLKVGNRQLKVAHLPSLSGQHPTPM